MVSYTGKFFNKLPSFYGGSPEIKDMVAFTQAVYPFFSGEKFFKDVAVILSKKKECSILKQTFFRYYYAEKNSWYSNLPFISGVKSKKVEGFYSLPLDERESAIVEYISFIQGENPDELLAFDTARNGLLNHLIRHSYSPFSAYGYPDRRILPFMADPSWPEYHAKPGTIVSFR